MIKFKRFPSLENGILRPLSMDLTGHIRNRRKSHELAVKRKSMDFSQAQIQVPHPDQSPLFGKSISEDDYLIFDVMDHIERYGLLSRGLFVKDPARSQYMALLDKLEQKMQATDLINYDMLACSKFIMDWFSMLPQAPLPYESVKHLVQMTKEEGRLIDNENIIHAIQSLPLINILMLNRLFLLLKKVVDNGMHNGADIVQLSKTIIPVLMRRRSADDTSRVDIEWCTGEEIHLLSTIAQRMIDQSESLFPTSSGQPIQYVSLLKEPSVKEPDVRPHEDSRCKRSTTQERVTLRKTRSQSQVIDRHTAFYTRSFSDSRLDPSGGGGGDGEGSKAKKKSRASRLVTMVFTKLKRGNRN